MGLNERRVLSLAVPTIAKPMQALAAESIRFASVDLIKKFSKCPVLAASGRERKQTLAHCTAIPQGGHADLEHVFVAD